MQFTCSHMSRWASGHEKSSFTTRTCRLSSRCSQDHNTSSVQDVLVKLQRGKGGRKHSPEHARLDRSQHATAQQPATASGAASAFDAEGPPRVLSDRQLLTFERKGHLCTRELLAPHEVAGLHADVSKQADARTLTALQHRMRVLLPPQQQVVVTSREQGLKHLRKHSRELGFLQHFNLHRDMPLIRSLVFSKRLAAVAAQLLGVKRLRLYQDCAFCKEPGFTETNWHSDASLSPLDTNDFVTAWIPLRPIMPFDDSGLQFAEGSHRDVALHFLRAGKGNNLQGRGYKLVSVGKMDAGDVSWHHGWLLHAAPPQPQHSPARVALAVSYFGDGARVSRLQCSAGDQSRLEDMESFADWIGTGPGKLGPGAVARHALTPLISL